MGQVLWWAAAIAAGLGIPYLGCLWLARRLDAALSVTPWRARR